MTKSPRFGRALRFSLPLLVVLLGGRLLYRSPYNASQMQFAPDEAEYAWCAKRFVTLGRYDIEIAGEAHPPWSSPWFSLGVLAPAYWAAPEELGNGIWPVLALSVLALVAAYAVGAQIAGAWAGALSVAALLSNSLFFVLSRAILSDVPAAGLGLLACWLYCRRNGSGPSARDCALAGLTVGAAFALRSVYLLLLAPFGLLWLRTKPRRPSHLALLLLPSLAVAVATAVYQQHAFGDWRRNGYQYWSAVPYDYSELVFSLGYVNANLRMLRAPPAILALVLGALGTALLLGRRVARAKPLLLFTALAAGPMTLLHLVYFYPSLRFQLFALVLSSVLGGAGIAALVPEPLRRFDLVAAAGLAVALFAVPRSADPPPRHRQSVDAIFAATPADAVVVSALDPVYLQAFAPPESRRVWIPISRIVPYAATLATARRVDHPDPPPRGPFDHRCRGLLAGGSRDVVPFTAVEAPQELIQWIRDGRSVFLDSTALIDRAAIQHLRSKGLLATGVLGYPTLARVSAPR